MKIIMDKLFKLQDIEYKTFTERSIPNIDGNKIIGVRLPDIRNLVKEIEDEDYIDEFLNELPHKYHEENLVHGVLLSTRYKDIDIALDMVDKFIPYADNWAVTDTIKPKIFKKYPDKVYEYIVKWVNSNREYSIRFGVVTLLNYYLDDNFDKKILKLVSKIKYDSYYVNMAIAWFYSFALVKQYDSTIKYIEDNKLSVWIHNKSIQKAIESYRITDDKKNYLRSLKR